MTLRKRKPRVPHTKKVGDHWIYDPPNWPVNGPGEVTITKTSDYTAVAEWNLGEGQSLPIRLEPEAIASLYPPIAVVVEGVDIQKGVWLEMLANSCGDVWSEYLVHGRCGESQLVTLQKNGATDLYSLAGMKARKVRLARGRYKNAAEWNLEVFRHKKWVRHSRPSENELKLQRVNKKLVCLIVTHNDGKNGPSPPLNRLCNQRWWTQHSAAASLSIRNDWIRTFFFFTRELLVSVEPSADYYFEFHQRVRKGLQSSFCMRRTLKKKEKFSQTPPLVKSAYAADASRSVWNVKMILFRLSKTKFRVEQQLTVRFLEINFLILSRKTTGEQIQKQNREAQVQ